jgi:gas vesicle protein
MGRRRKNNPLVSLLIGGVIGGTAALVMAPASGRETRSSIGNGVNKVLFKANEQKNFLIRNAQKFANELMRRSTDIYNKSVGFAEGSYSNSADSIELEIRSFKNALNAAVEAYRNTKTGNKNNRPEFGDQVIVNEMFTDFEDETLPKQEGMGRRQE